MKKVIVLIITVLLAIGLIFIYESNRPHNEVVPKQLIPTQIPSPTVTPTIYISEYVNLTMPHDGLTYSCKRLKAEDLKQASNYLSNTKSDSNKCNESKKDSISKCEEDCKKIGNERIIKCTQDCVSEVNSHCNDLSNRVSEAELAFTALFSENCK